MSIFISTCWCINSWRKELTWMQVLEGPRGKSLHDGQFGKTAHMTTVMHVCKIPWCQLFPPNAVMQQCVNVVETNLRLIQRLDKLQSKRF